MPFAYNDGVKIRYEVEGTGPPLVFIDGFFGFVEDWYLLGYVDKLKASYQLILIDPRGCGESATPYDVAAYDLSMRVGDVIAVLDALDVHTTHYFGYSMGGYIGWGIVKYAPQRLHSVIALGHGPPEQPRFADVSGPNSIQESVDKDIDVWVDMVKNIYGEYWIPELEPYFRRCDLKALWAAAGNWEGFSFKDVLAKVTIPALFIVGENDGALDPIKQACEVIPDAEIVVLSGCDHMLSQQRSDLVIP